MILILILRLTGGDDRTADTKINFSKVQYYKGKIKLRSKDDEALFKQTPDNNNALIIPPYFLPPIIKSRF